MLLTRAAISKVHYIYDTLRPNLQIQKEYTQYDFIDIEISQHAYAHVSIYIGLQMP